MFYIYEIIISIIISTIEGITEFLPISSTGHIIVISHWLGISNQNINIFKIFVQLGSSLAILIFFFKQIINLMIPKIKKKQKKYIF